MTALPPAEINRRFTYHQPDSATVDDLEDIRGRVLDFAHYLNSALPPGRETSLALTKLEEVAFHAISARVRPPSSG